MSTCDRYRPDRSAYSRWLVAAAPLLWLAWNA
jgi:hypothetical protein